MKRFISLIIAIILVISCQSQLPTSCFDTLINSQSCLWYPDCLELKYQCGSQGYPIGYGFKYCNKFGQLKTYQSARTWIQKTTVCLKKKLSVVLDTDVSMSCHALRNFAFDTHPHCYQESGFCQLWKELGPQDSAIFLRQLLGIFDPRDFQSLSAIRQIEEMVALCV